MVEDWLPPKPESPDDWPQIDIANPTEGVLNLLQIVRTETLREIRQYLLNGFKDLDITVIDNPKFSDFLSEVQKLKTVIRQKDDLINYLQNRINTLERIHSDEPEIDWENE